ncbi:MAG TPA: hypothetical protein VK818_17795, partial [Methylomirabilota bacterium]|nr:hypothetical protein [Methylomirabilota bacterium]
HLMRISQWPLFLHASDSLSGDALNLVHYHFLVLYYLMHPAVGGTKAAELARNDVKGKCSALRLIK